MSGIKTNLAGLPYRCPQCHKHDKIKDFSTLSCLKHHLREQHGYRSKNEDTNGRTSPLTSSFQDHLKSLEEKLNQAKKDEGRNMHNMKSTNFSHHRSSPFPVAPVHPTIPTRTPVYNRPKNRYDQLPGYYHSNYVIRNSPQYLGPHKFTASVPVTSRPKPNLPQTFDVKKQQSDTQNQSVRTRNVEAISIKPKVTPRETQADETLSKMLDKTEGDLNALKLQVESNLHPQEAKSMTHTLNTARSQVENLRKTAEKITGEQQSLIDQLHKQLKNRDDHMKKAKKELDNLRTDRNKLRRDLDDKEKKTNQTEEELALLKSFLEEKEERITLKERELEELSDFVTSASAHEVQARDKLENFITSILDRAQQAEGEVHSLKAQLSLTPLVQSRNTTPLVNVNQNVSQPFSPLNTTFRPVVHSTPAPSVNSAPQSIPPKLFNTDHVAPGNTSQKLTSQRIRLSPGQVVANLHGSLVDPRSPLQSSAYSVNSVVHKISSPFQQRSAYHASPVWSDIDRTPIQTPVAQRLHVARHAPRIDSPLTLNQTSKVGENGFGPEPLALLLTDQSVQSPPNAGQGKDETTFRPIKSSPIEQEAVEEIIRPVDRDENKNIAAGYFSLRRANEHHQEDPEIIQAISGQLGSNPRRVEKEVSDVSVQTAAIKTASEMVGTSPPQQPYVPQASVHIASVQHLPYQTTHQNHPSAPVNGASMRHFNPPVEDSYYHDFQPVQLIDPNTPFIAPSIPDHGFQSPLMYSVAKESAMNSYVPYYEELTGFAPLLEDDVHSWVDSQNRMFPLGNSQSVQLQNQPDFSVPAFAGYVLPDADIHTGVGLPKKGKPLGTSDSGIGSYPSSRATVHAPVSSQYYPMATVMENGTIQRSSLSVDEQGILWDNNGYIAASPPHEKRNGKQRTHPNFNTNDPQLNSDWNKRITEALESENKELRERLMSLQKKQNHIRSQQSMAAAQGFVSDPEEYSKESDNEFLTADESSDIERSDLLDNEVTTDEKDSEASTQVKKHSNRQAERQRLVRKLLKSREQRNRDALFCVFMYLDTKTLSKISQVCKDWREISRHPALWRRLELNRTRISSKFLKTISGWCTQLQSLSLGGLKGRRKTHREDNDEYLKNTRGSLEEGFEHLLTASQNTLISLKIIDCGNILTDRCLYLAGCYSRLLQRVVYISDSHPAGPEAIWTLGAGCRAITTLIIPPLFPSQKPRRFENGCVKRIGKCWPDLRVVCIGGIEVNTKGLISLVRSCPRLSVLELDHMCEIGEDDAQALCSVGLKGMEELDFTFTPVTPKAILHFISACPQLKSVGVHIGISDYFDDTASSKNRQHFKEIVSKLNRLLKRPGVKDILQIRSDYG